VIAAVAFGLSAGLPLLDACKFANRAAGVVVGKLGSATVSLDEIRAAGGGGRPELQNKIVDLDTAAAQLAAIRRAGRKVVFTNGCFDILHAGHVRYLAAAAALGDVLVVGLNTDASVRKLKGAGRPINGEQDRALLLAGLASVSFVVPFAEDTPIHLIEKLVPDVLVKGGDYRADDIVGADVVRRAGGKVEVLPFLEGRSTSAVIERIAKGGAA
jgi:D-beta-D-heptose 7-phosphate kinase/D-beta-D-heptose 1-phosphate adenosyltransferase